MNKPLLVVTLAALGSVFALPPTASADPPDAVASTIEVPDFGEYADLDVNVRPDDYFADEFPEFGPTTGAHVGLTGADAWHAAGIDGTGVRIGVIDFFDVGLYWRTAENGPIPVPNVTARCIANGSDCSGIYFDGNDEGGDDHGVAVVELIKDMAPGAEIYIGTAATPTDYIALVDWFASKGVTVISRSLGSRYDGPGDGRSAMTDVAAYANAKGITWVNSGGNNAVSRYYRQPVRRGGLGNQQVLFGPSGSTVSLRANGCLALGGVRWVNDWDKPAAQRTDYDVYIVEASSTDPTLGRQNVDGSDLDQQSGAAPLEHIFDSYCPSATGRSLYLEIDIYADGSGIDGDVIEILDYGSGFAQFTQSEYSASTSIVDSNLPGVLAVAAVDPPGTGTIGFYSSQGPTNDNRLAPDIAAPSGFRSEIFNGLFQGTSAAAPVIAGGAALLIDAGLAATPEQVGNLMRTYAVDLGTAGPDNAFGYGEFHLPYPLDSRPSRFVAMDAPLRVLDTRSTSPAGPAHLIARVPAGGVIDLPILTQAGISPTDVTAVAINLTAVGVDRPSYVQALPTGRARITGYSNINLEAAGQTRANMAIVPIGQNGSISVYSSGSSDIVIDLLGYYSATSGAVQAGRFVELPVPQRLIDTRDTSALQALTPRQIPWPVGIDQSQVSAMVVTVTGTLASSSGWVQAHPADRLDVVAKTSTVNFGPGESVANTAIVPVGPGGLAVTGFFGPGGTGHVVIDLVGYITSGAVPASSEGRFVPLIPARAFDSRLSVGTIAAGTKITINANQAVGVTIPADASGVMWNIASVGARRPGFGRVWRAGATEPATSAFNWSRVGEVRAAAVIAAVDQGRIDVTLNDGAVNSGQPLADVIADVFGYFT